MITVPTRSVPTVLAIISGFASFICRRLDLVSISSRLDSFDSDELEIRQLQWHDCFQCHLIPRELDGGILNVEFGCLSFWTHLLKHKRLATVFTAVVGAYVREKSATRAFGNQ